jgi:hypothetical protein
MRCSECHRFDREARSCKDGKLNPQRRSEAVDVVWAMGPRALCIFNDFREELITTRTQDFRSDGQSLKSSDVNSPTIRAE